MFRMKPDSGHYHSKVDFIAGTLPSSEKVLPTISFEQMTGFSLFMLKAVLSGRGDEIIDLAKINLFR